jgi:hypothetical protein
MAAIEPASIEKLQKLPPQQPAEARDFVDSPRPPGRAGE